MALRARSISKAVVRLLARGQRLPERSAGPVSDDVHGALLPLRAFRDRVRSAPHEDVWGEVATPFRLFAENTRAVQETEMIELLQVTLHVVRDAEHASKIWTQHAARRPTEETVSRGRDVQIAFESRVGGRTWQLVRG